MLENPVEICSFPSVIRYIFCMFHDRQMLKVEELDDVGTFSIIFDDGYWLLTWLLV